MNKNIANENTPQNKNIDTSRSPEQHSNSNRLAEHIITISIRRRVKEVAEEIALEEVGEVRPRIGRNRTSR